MTEEECRGAGVCLGFCDAENFLEAQMNATQYEDYPLGCFLHTKVGTDRQCVHYNPLPAGWTAPTDAEWQALAWTTPDPVKKEHFPRTSILLGTPICSVGGVTTLR